MSLHLAVLGPTASGKSQLALRLATELGGEIINCDSLQVYRSFDIGTAKPKATERANIPHHMFDVVAWNQEFDAGTYAKQTNAILDDLASHNKCGVIVGGSGLYFRALMGQSFHEALPKSDVLRARLSLWSPERLSRVLKRLDPQRATQIHPHDRFRMTRALELRVLRRAPMNDLALTSPPPSAKPIYVILLAPEREWLRARIRMRVEAMVAGGLVEEVERLLRDGVDPDCKPMQSIGYKETLAYLAGSLTKPDLVEQIYIATCQYAKRQYTWFKKTKVDLTISEAYDFREVLDALPNTPGKL